MRERIRTLWPALPLLGAALTLLAALATWPVSGAGLQPDEATSVALAEGEALAWTFATERGGLSGLRVWLEQPAPATGSLAVTIAAAELPDLPLVIAEAPLSAAGADGALDLTFDPLREGASPHEPTATLQVRLVAEGLRPGASLALRGADEQRVAFAPRYQERPFDTLLPISAIAAGRPGLLGWPPLYALLAYALLVALLRALWQGWSLGTADEAPERPL